MLIITYKIEAECKMSMPMPDILKLAMKREEKADLLYNILADHTEDEAAKKVFMILVQEKSKYKLALEKIYNDYLGDKNN